MAQPQSERRVLQRCCGLGFEGCGLRVEGGGLIGFRNLVFGFGA